MTFPWSFRRGPPEPPSTAGELPSPDNARVARFWDRQAGTWGAGGEARHWTELPQVQEVVNRRVSGEATVDPYLHFLRTRLSGRLPVGRALTIGCGSGALERGLCQYGFAKAHEALDVSPRSIEIARGEAATAGLGHLSYRVADANALRLERSAFDVVFGVHSIHHIARLEDVFREVAAALKPDGLLFMNEFVGPTRFQWTARQLEVVNGVLRALPERFRASVVDGRPKGAVPRPTVEEMIAADPSEAVRSAEILDVASRFFEILEVRPYGGTVLHVLLDDIAGNFARAGAEGRALLAAIADLEWALIGTGDLSSDFAVIVGRPKG